MKSLFSFFCLLSFAFLSTAQNPTHEEKLVATCKVWSYFKYFHDGPTYCRVNWDNALVLTLPKIKAAQTKEAFNLALLELINAAGNMPQPTTQSTRIPTGYNTNLNTDWFFDDIFELNVRNQLITVRERFRPHTICFVNDNKHRITNKGWIYFEDDTTLPDASQNPVFPNADHRLLVAFRYWSYIEYFFNSKNLMDVPWDVTLKKIIGAIDKAVDKESYALSLLELTAGINDTHGSSSGSTIIGAHVGNAFPPLLTGYVDNKVVVKRIFDHSIGLKVGDIISKINGVPIDTVLNNRKKYINHSNPSSLYRDLLDGVFNIFRGELNAIIALDVERNGVKWVENVRRTYSVQNFFAEKRYPQYPTYERMPNLACNIGYVNMGTLQRADVQAMFNTLKTTDALIFDLRNYPNATAGDICSILSPQSYNFAIVNVPSTTYPGILLSNAFEKTTASNSEGYRKPIYVLVNEYTQSQAEYSVMMLQALPNTLVKVVGSQTAGADGNITIIDLPGGFRTYYSTLGIFYPDGTPAQRVGVRINHVVKPTIKGITEGRDEVLDYVLQTLTKCKTVNSNDIENEQTSIALSPNPSSGFIHIAIENVEAAAISIDIVNILGESVLTLARNRPVSGRFEENVQADNLSSGLYFVKVLVKNKTFSKKLVLKR